MKKEDVLYEILREDDETFMDKYLLNLTDEELTRFLEDNPDFLDGLVEG